MLAPRNGIIRFPFSILHLNGNGVLTDSESRFSFALDCASLVVRDTSSAVMYGTSFFWYNRDVESYENRVDGSEYKESRIVMAKKVDHAARKLEIAEKAMRLFSQVGYDNVSLIMIAAASGVSRTALYQYFCSKREVMDASIRTVLDEIDKNCTQIISSRQRTLEKLEGVCHAVVDVMFRKRAFVISVFDFVLGMVRSGANMSDGIYEFTSGTRNALRRLIEHAIARGELPSVLVADRMTDAIYAEFESCAMRIVLGTEKTAEAAKVRFSDLIHALAYWKE